MRQLQAIGFCGAALFASIGLCILLMPEASMSTDELTSLQTPRAMEDYEPIDLGEEFGELLVLDLIGYYLDNPPAPESPLSSPKRKQQFGGC